LDRDDAPVFLARNSWDLERTTRDWPDLQFLAVKERA
jgi:peptide chain release factor 3